MDRQAERKRERIEEVLAAAGEGEERPPGLRAFVEGCLEGAAVEDLEEADPGELAAMLRSFYGFAARRRPGEPELRIWNPSVEDDGWTSEHTALEIVTDDMPFLVDSLSGALARRDLAIHLALHPQMRVRRDPEGELRELTVRDEVVESGVRPRDAVDESHMHFEIDRVTAPARLVELETELRKVLVDVRTAVEDWPPMREAALAAVAELEAAGELEAAAEVEEPGEAVSFLRWLAEDHFTFLGYQAYALEDRGGELYLRRVRGSGLGLSRKPPLGERAEEGRPVAPAMRRFLESERLVEVVKTATEATVHRNVFMDAVAVKRFDPSGQVRGIHRFVGLFTSMAYSIAARDIPLVRRKVARVIERTALVPRSHDAKALRHIVENYPRDELLQISEDEMVRFARRILELQLRPRVALLVRGGESGRLVSCMVYVPRERHSTDLRLRIQEILEGAYGGEARVFSVRVSDRPLAQLQFLVSARPERAAGVDVDGLEERLAEAARSWSERLRDTLTLAAAPGALATWRRYRNAFPGAYQETVEPEAAARDIEIIESVLASGRLGLRLYRRRGAAVSRFHLRTFELAIPAPLSQVLPRLENMGLEVNTEIPYEVRPQGAANPVWVRDFELLAEGFEVDLESAAALFEDAFVRVWAGEVENDGFNQLVLRAGLGWRQVVLVRAFCKYLRQAGIAFSQSYMEETLARNPHVARLVVELFEATFDPERQGEVDGHGPLERRRLLRREIRRALERVESVDEDRILRRYLDLVENALRTNHYQLADGRPKGYLALKLDASRLRDLPPPRPAYEVFVYSPQVEAVHLRGGRVARGGILRSDRREDFRTEVLGLLKAQMVKNAVIVPVGAKGGFVVKQPPMGRDREELEAEAVSCYRTLIRGLLDLTDNLEGDRVVPPPRVVRRDGDDPYLVVSPDTGTARYADVANRLAAEAGFWLGDAFASGGSAGYDPKRLGITARGVWEAVKRHFHEMGRDVASEPFTVAGVGEPSDDVFGNALLLSRQARLVAAFDGGHVLLDPDPDPEAAFAERQRLLELEGSTWADYDPEALSPGGAVVDRGAKEVSVSPRIAEVLGLAEATLAPDELVRAILAAPVDLLVFAGAGTLVKAAGESHEEVGDRAHDEVRVDASRLRARVVVEGSSLALTQAARVEYALAGGRINADFIDSAAGVACSDREVNVKIALDEAAAQGELEPGERERLLATMADEVAALVLRDTYLQTQAISLVAAQGPALLGQQARLVHRLERAGLLDRQLAGLPDETTLAERRERQLGLTRPEIAVLLAYAKIHVYGELLLSDLPDDVLLREDLVRYFPSALHWRFRDAFESHRLRREIIATQVTNSLVDRLGPTFVSRLVEETGAGVSDIARTYAAVREIFALRLLWEDVEDLDGRVPAALQLEMHVATIGMVERATRWFLRTAGRPLDVTACVARYESDIIVVAAQIEEFLPPAARRRLDARFAELRRRGLSAALASRVAASHVLPAACDVARCARLTGVPVERVGQIYFTVGERFGFDRLRRAASRLTASSPWQQTAITAAVEDLDAHQAELARQVALGPGEPEAALAGWIDEHGPMVRRLDALLAELEAAPRLDLAMLALAEHQLRRLVAAGETPAVPIPK